MVSLLRIVRQLVGCILVGGVTLPSAAQKVRPPVKKVYDFVEQMPQLPGGGGSAAIATAIQQRLIYPPEALNAQVDGRVFVSFIVTTTGAVTQVKVVKSLVTVCDVAAVQAVRQLPRFTPGRQKGRPVCVQFTVPITFRIEE